MGDSVKADISWTYNWFPVLLHNDRSEDSVSSDYKYKEQDVGEGGDGADPAGSPVAHGEGGRGHSEVYLLHQHTTQPNSDPGREGCVGMWSRSKVKHDLLQLDEVWFRVVVGLSSLVGGLLAGDRPGAGLLWEGTLQAS